MKRWYELHLKEDSERVAKLQAKKLINDVDLMEHIEHCEKNSIVDLLHEFNISRGKLFDRIRSEVKKHDATNTRLEIEIILRCIQERRHLFDDSNLLKTGFFDGLKFRRNGSAIKFLYWLERWS